MIEIGYIAIKIDPDSLEDVKDVEEDTPEKIRSESGNLDVPVFEEEIPRLEPVLLHMKHCISLPSYPTLQIIQIFPSNIFKTKYSLRVSAGLFWIVARLHSDQSKLIKDGVLKDMI